MGVFNWHPVEALKKAPSKFSDEKPDQFAPPNAEAGTQDPSAYSDFSGEVASFGVIAKKELAVESTINEATGEIDWKVVDESAEEAAGVDAGGEFEEFLKTWGSEESKAVVGLSVKDGKAKVLYTAAASDASDTKSPSVKQWFEDEDPEFPELESVSAVKQIEDALAPGNYADTDFAMPPAPIPAGLALLSEEELHTLSEWCKAFASDPAMYAGCAHPFKVDVFMASFTENAEPQKLYSVAWSNGEKMVFGVASGTVYFYEYAGHAGTVYPSAHPGIFVDKGKPKPGVFVDGIKFPSIEHIPFHEGSFPDLSDVPPAVSEPQRTIIVGDVHGCIDELYELFNDLGFNPGDDRLIFIGDLLDRGPNSIGVLRLAHGLGAEVVLGNHEEKYLRYRNWEKKIKKLKKKPPGFHPPKMTPSKMAIYQQLTDDDFEFMRSWPYVLSLGDFDGDPFAAVHAGLETSFLLGQQDPTKVIRTRWVSKHGVYLPTAPGTLDRPEGGIRWTHRWKGPESIVYGHAVRDLKDPSIEGGKKVKTYGIDTGCVFGGRLSALVLPDREIVQVEARKEYKKPTLDYD